MRCLPFLAAAAAACFAFPARAQTAHDAQLWFNATAMGGVGGDIVYFAEVQPRLENDVSRFQQIILRPAIGVRLSPALTLYQGYAHVVLPRDSGPDRSENRSFQQASWNLGRVGTGDLSSRTRLEQRWRSDGDDMGLRFRQFVRYALPLRDQPRDRPRGPAALGWVEGFFALNSTDWGARAGFDQARTFLGLELPVGGPSTAEVGYLNQVINDPGGRTRMGHSASITLFLRR